MVKKHYQRFHAFLDTCGNSLIIVHKTILEFIKGKSFMLDEDFFG